MSLPSLYTPEEVAERLRVTRRSIYEWLKSGRLKGLRAGQYWRVTESDLLAFLASEILPTRRAIRKKR